MAKRGGWRVGGRVGYTMARKLQQKIHVAWLVCLYEYSTVSLAKYRRYRDGLHQEDVTDQR